MTLSIVACDLRTGALGAAAAGAFAVGTSVPAARPGVGAVAVGAGTRAMDWRVKVLDALATGRAVEPALDRLAADEAAAGTQFAAVDRRGQVGAFTGTECEPLAGHAVAEGVCAQAVGAARDDEWKAMLERYREVALPLPRRLLTALAAGERRRSELTASRSAALVVVGAGLDLDLRVDDHPQPLDELARLLDVHDARDLIERSRAPRVDRALAVQHALGALRLAPDDMGCVEAAAEALALAGRHQEAAVHVARLGARRGVLERSLRARADRGELVATADYYALLRALRDAGT